MFYGEGGGHFGCAGNGIDAQRCVAILRGDILFMEIKIGNEM